MLALINEKISQEFENKTGIRTVALKPYRQLDLPVSSHADMLLCVIEDRVFCYKDYALENALVSKLSGAGFKAVFVSKECGKQYPCDIGLNVLIMGKTLFCNSKHTAKEIIDFATQSGYEIVNVKQGYAACSTLVLNENCAITSDMSIASAIKQVGKEAILIDNSKIRLDGYNCGFIGGASGVLGEDVFVFGEIKTLVNGEKIAEKIHSLGYNIIPILSGEVCDFGGIKFI